VQQHDEIAQYPLSIAPKNLGKRVDMTAFFEHRQIVAEMEAQCEMTV
jgi:hypothetical protein